MSDVLPGGPVPASDAVVEWARQAGLVVGTREVLDVLAGLARLPDVRVRPAGCVGGAVVITHPK
ncbi:hypothetical protein ACIQUQ_28330 [Streptomyces sp. NPDC101118]|uniref:hypothetical protein n=1 Tax=Streptomyces sp. NPDC101118 TaxID=3366109 RepID=UPI003816F4FB